MQEQEGILKGRLDKLEEKAANYESWLKVFLTIATLLGITWAVTLGYVKNKAAEFNKITVELTEKYEKLSKQADGLAKELGDLNGKAENILRPVAPKVINDVLKDQLHDYIKRSDIEPRLKAAEEKIEKVPVDYFEVPNSQLDNKLCASGNLACLTSAHSFCDAKGYRGAVPVQWSDGKTHIVCFGRK